MGRPAGTQALSRIVWPHWVSALSLSALASAFGRLAGALSDSGALAAAVVGTVVAGAGGWDWAVVLVVFVATASAASALPPHAQRPRRTARQVFANGAVACAAALLHQAGVANSGAAFAGAVSSAWADTWAAELGVRYGGSPWSLRDGRRLEPGTSGGITVVGTAAGILAAVACGLLAAVVGVAPLGATAVAGCAGMAADSLLGAGWQARFSCSCCGRTGEEPRCPCGAVGRCSTGIRWLDNDVTNLLATCVGAGVSVLWAQVAIP
ncbi:MAG: hypothetical protein C4304_05585 [candidate division GAL15 bacterium]